MKDFLVRVQMVTTYEIDVRANSGADLMNYPKSARELPPEVVFKFANLSYTGEAVDSYIQVIEVIDLDKELGIEE